MLSSRLYAATIFIQLTLNRIKKYRIWAAVSTHNVRPKSTKFSATWGTSLTYYVSNAICVLGVTGCELRVAVQRSTVIGHWIADNCALFAAYYLLTTTQYFLPISAQGYFG